MRNSRRSFKLERAQSFGHGRSSLSVMTTSDSLSEVAGYKKLSSKSMRLSNNYCNEIFMDNRKFEIGKQEEKKKKNLSFRFLRKVFTFNKKGEFDNGMRERLEVKVNVTSEFDDGSGFDFDGKKKKKRFPFKRENKYERV